MLKIILVDDEEFIRLGLEKIFGRMDLNVSVIGSYANGMSAFAHISKLHEDEIDVLITDVKMPVMNGLKLIEAVRERMPKLPIIILSGFSDFEYARMAMRNGVTDYLLKPVVKTQLYELLAKLAARGRTADKPDVRSAEWNENYLVEQIKQYLDHHYDKNFELDKLAEELDKNASYISRVFKLHTSITITDYLIQTRIDRAKQFLIDHPQLKNYEVSQLVGYQDAVYFNKLFKKMTGVTPREYKDRFQV